MKLVARPVLALLGALMICCVSPWSLSAQEAVPAAGTSPETLNGSVVLEGTGSRTPAELPVELHRVTPATSGVVDRTTTSATGAFEFTLPPIDTAGFTVFFATVEHLGVRYFGRPLHQGEARDDYRIEVFDTTSAPQAPARITRRDMVMMVQQDGSWEVNEIVRITNPTRTTIVSASGAPVTEVDIPEEAAAFEAGDGDAPTDRVRRMGDRVLLLMPLLPGDREIFFRYRLPAHPASMEFGAREAADSVNLFVRQPAPALTVTGLEAAELIDVEGERFLHYAAAESSEPVRVEWRGSGSPINPVTASVGLILVVFGVGGWAAFRNRTA